MPAAPRITVAAQAGSAAATPDNAVLLTVFLKHDQSRPLAELNAQLAKQGFYTAFPPPGIDVVSWTRLNHLAASAADPLILATGAMMQRGFRVARIGLPRRSFILGSSPFARFMSHSERRQDLGDPEAELWLPIAPDVALASYGHAGTTGFMELARDAHIRQVNGTIVRASTAFASPHRDLVEALARRISRP